jgi:ferredoxin--NADP+ reductase
MTDYIENASIIYRSDIGERQCIVRVALDEGELPSFEPGQYAELALPSLDTQQEKQVQAKKLIRRAYSIASTPEISNWYEFYVVLVPSGALTPDLLLVPVGGRVWLGPKVKGKFTLTEIPEGKNVVAVSTGTGIAPFVSMVRHHINNPPWKTFTLVHGAKTEDELGYYEELSTYSYSSESFK